MDFQSERLPRCSGGLWLQCCTLHLFTAERQTSMWGKRRAGVWCTSSSLEIRLRLIIFYFGHHSRTETHYLRTCKPVYVISTRFTSFGIDYLDNGTKEEKLQNVGAWRDQGSFECVCWRWTLLSRPSKQLSWWQNGRQAGRAKMKSDSISRTLTCSANANPWF